MTRLSPVRQELWPLLHTGEAEGELVKELQQHVRDAERGQATTRAGIIYLEAHLLDVACDDPGRTITSAVLLPLLRHRIEAGALEYYNRDVLAAERKVCAPLKNSDSQAFQLIVGQVPTRCA